MAPFLIDLRILPLTKFLRPYSEPNSYDGGGTELIISIWGIKEISEIAHRTWTRFGERKILAISVLMVPSDLLEMMIVVLQDCAECVKCPKL